MNDAIPPPLAGARVAPPGIRASGLLALGIRAMALFTAKGFAPCAIAIGAIAAFWGLPSR